MTGVRWPEGDADEADKEARPAAAFLKRKKMTKKRGTEDNGEKHLKAKIFKD
jgi:hypothetical protein